MRKQTQNTRSALGVEMLEDRELLAPVVAGGQSDLIMFCLPLQASGAPPAQAGAAADVYKVRWGVAS